MNVLTSNQFASIFGLKPKRYAWLLGAGASATSGIPTGYQMILDFKTTLFCQYSGISRRDVDASDPIWQQRIQEFFSRRSELPPDGDPTEYARAFETVYPKEADRRQYIYNAVRKGIPTIGHRVLGSLIASKLTDCVFTTNFDQLIETSATLANSLLPPTVQATPTVAAIDNVERAERVIAESDWPLIAKLHGDYQSVELKNTSDELLHQDERMRRVLISAFQRFGLIVIGYSGRDASVMDAFGAALRIEGAFSAGVYWVCNDANKLIPAVKQFLSDAHALGIDAYAVECANFDEFASNLIEAVELPAALANHVFSARPPSTLVTEPLIRSAVLKFPILRCSALPILTIPEVSRRISLSEASTTSQCRELLKVARCHGVVACNGREVAAFGNDNELLAALSSLGATLNGTISLQPIENSWARGIMYDGLIRALCRNRPLQARLQSKGHAIAISREPRELSEDMRLKRQHQLSKLLTAYSNDLLGSVSKINGSFAEGVTLRLDYANAQWWCGFELITFVDTPRLKMAGADIDRDNGHANPRPVALIADWQRERWATRYNGFWTAAITAWAELFAGDGDAPLHAFGFGEGDGIDASFQLGSKTAWSRPAHEHAYFARGQR
jgi:hypothetical protein